MEKETMHKNSLFVCACWQQRDLKVRKRTKVCNKSFLHLVSINGLERKLRDQKVTVFYHSRTGNCHRPLDSTFNITMAFSAD